MVEGAYYETARSTHKLVDRLIAHTVTVTGALQSGSTPAGRDGQRPLYITTSARATGWGGGACVLFITMGNE